MLRLSKQENALLREQFERERERFRDLYGEALVPQLRLYSVN
jgi:hypothetical protein